MDNTFFLNYGSKDLLKYHSIKPGRGPDGVSGSNATRSHVTDVCVLEYFEGKIRYKLNFESEFEDLPIRPKQVDFLNALFSALYRQ